jgi:alpha-glucosidase (family GH31 glycosyl hydrolase)
MQNALEIAKRRLLVLFLLLLAFAGFALAQGPTDNPIADPKAVVVSGQARFTLLTPQLIRMEWSENSQFEDHASLVFINRRLPVPPFEGRLEDGWLILHTDKLTLRYREGSGQFTRENLRIEFDLNGKSVAWTPGTEDKGNLLGTTRTLDGVRGSTPLGPGLISRDGWVLVDDTERLLYDGSEWNWAMPRPAGKRQDWYFFGYGHEFRKALGDFTRVAGKIPLPPRFAFGSWWSRYWAYTDQEFAELVREFREHDVPLDVLVIDMDWHPTFGVKWWENRKDQSGHTLGWTGYTWNSLYFPDPAGFLKWVHEQGLKATLNMHPASGVQPFEKPYPEMARAMGIDPATQKYVPFDIANKRFAENYMNILHHPLEKQGVDFFWLDWQQESQTSQPGLNPTWWLNYVHFTDMERRGLRPIIYHRWGGLGNHRYEIGFSGDVISSWESLNFQPYFTATAANVGYGYWSHDIGGHIPGPVLAEMYTRWVQFGAFSPILRTHTTKNPTAERRIWAYPPDFAKAMRDAFLLRYALIPYIYTSARNTYDTGASICLPLYYDYPEVPEAYEFKDEYFFGNAMLVAPVSSAVEDRTALARRTVWLPEGDWIEWFTGAHLKGPARFERTFALGDIPVYVRAGSIIPMQPKMSHTGEKPVDPLILTIFPGDSGETRVYDDEGNTPGYKQNVFTLTPVRHSRAADGARRIEILPVEGSFPGMLTQRGYEIRLPGTWPPESVTFNGKNIAYLRTTSAPGWTYDGNTLTTVISLPRMSARERVEVLVRTSPALLAESQLLDGVPGRLARLRTAMAILSGSWPRGWAPDNLIEAAQTGDRISYQPATALEELRTLQSKIPEIVQAISAMEVAPDFVIRALGHLGQPVRIVPAAQPEKP